MPATPILPKDAHYAYLDGLRGVAVLIVVFSHASNAGLHVVPMVDARATGVVGVWLFFVLSAFLLTGRLHAAAVTSGLNAEVLFRYAVARVARIYPAYGMTMLVYVAAGLFTLEVALEHLALRRGDGVFWSIPVEIKYYVAMPLLVVLYRVVFGARAVLFTVACALGAAAWVVLVAPPLASPATSIALSPYLSAFLAGSCAALLLDAYGERLRAPAWLVGLSLALIVVSAPAMIALLDLPRPSEAMWTRYNPAYGVLWAVAIVAAHRSGLWRRLFSPAWLRFVGRISFSVYLLHRPILDAVERWSFVPDEAKGVLVLALALAAAWVSYTFVEAPGVAAGRRLAAGFRRPRIASP